MPRWRALSSSDPSIVATNRWRLDLAYDGHAFHGFAYQPEFTTVVGVLRSTLARTLHMEAEPLVVGAGRTDAGVHAFAQVVHVDLPQRLFASHRGPEPERLMLSLNQQLRGRIRVLAARVIDESFHARFSATWREYRYLDIEAMNKSCEDILGTHDFRAFCRRSAGDGIDDPIRRRVISARWEQLDDRWMLSPTGAPVALFTIRGQSFCHNMVRSLVSTMVAIGQGRLDQNIVKDRLLTRDRHQL